MGSSRSPAATRRLTAGLVIACIAFYVYSGLRYSPSAYFPPPRPATVVAAADILKEFDHALPKYTENIPGDRQQPLSMVIIARNDRNLGDAFAKAGWLPADPLRFDTFIKLAGALISRASYPSAPVAPSFWNRHVNEFSFEKPTPVRTVRQRHQAKLWKTDMRTSDGRAVYVGTAVLEVGLKWHVVYRIRPDVDAEPEGLLRNLVAAGVVASYGRNRFVPPMTGRNSFGDPFFTDGNITTIHLN